MNSGLLGHRMAIGAGGPTMRRPPERQHVIRAGDPGLSLSHHALDLPPACPTQRGASKA